MVSLMSVLAVLVLQWVDVMGASAPSVCERITDPVVRMCYSNVVVGQTVYLDTGDIGQRYLGTCPCTINAVQGGTFEITPTKRPVDPQCFVQIKFEDDSPSLIFCGTDNPTTITRDLSAKALDMGVFLVTEPLDPPTNTDFCVKLQITGVTGNVTVDCDGATAAPTMPPTIPPTIVTTGSSENSTTSGQDVLATNMFFLGYMTLTAVLYPLVR